jgi:hypothetical protein
LFVIAIDLENEWNFGHSSQILSNVSNSCLF